MTLVEIGVTRLMTRFSSVTRFVFLYTVNITKQATFWRTVFGAEDERTEDRVRILAVYINSENRLLQASSLDECIATLESWHFDFSEQKLYINFGPEFCPLMDQVDYQYAIGFCDEKPVYIDAVSYLPVMNGAPTVKSKQDIIGGDKIAMTSGSFSFSNNSGDMNFIKNLSLFSNDARVYFLDEDERDEYARDELVEQSQLLVEDVTVSLADGSITLQDIRKSFDVKMPEDLFEEADYPNAENDLYNKPIPLCYGTCRSIPATCTNGDITTGNVEYRAALVMTDFGIIEVEGDAGWIAVTPTAIDLAHGSFTLSQIDGRGESGNGPRECRLRECTGIAIDRLSDIIIDLDQRANGVNYNNTFYNVIEWEIEEAGISTGGYFIDDQKSLLEIIKAIQDGANRRFRFEITGDGRRTIRVDDNARASLMFVAKEMIKENQTFEITTDRSAVFANIEIKYDINFSDEKAVAVVVDKSRQEAVSRNLRQRPTISYETFLRTKELATERAAREALMLGEVWRYADITLFGKEFLTLRIFDILTIELFTDDDEWLGVWRSKVIATEPRDRQNRVKVQLIERVPFEDENKRIRITSDGAIRIATVGATDYWRDCT